jgi:hypothetical protein
MAEYKSLNFTVDINDSKLDSDSRNARKLVYVMLMDNGNFMSLVACAIEKKGHNIWIHLSLR